MIVAALWCDSFSGFVLSRKKLNPTISFIKRIATRSTLVTSTCSGAVLLADDGLLEGRQATVCWWLVDWFQRRFPSVQLVADKLVAKDKKVWTAAAGTAYLHLCLDILKQLAPASVLTLTSQLLLVEPRRGSQSPYLSREGIADESNDPVVVTAKRVIRNQLIKTISLTGLAKKLKVRERTLHRRFQNASTISPTAYIQNERVSRAKQLLENSNQSFESIVNECGYQDAATFRKLFTKLVGIPPGEYRLRFSQRQ